MYSSYTQLGRQEKQNVDLYDIEEIQTHEQKERLIKNNRIVCIDIYATWCSPCKQLEPKYSIVAKKYSKKGICAVVKENIDKKLTTG